MGERKGQNKYYPPDYDPKVGGLNKFLGTHALRERAKKIHLGILVIRFEMPYNIWCDGCKNHIGMGVRYNAEKSKIGMYYSTPVYQFRMKCHLCDNYIVMKTDPGNLDYEVVSGARRQENRWDPTENGQLVPDAKEVQHKLFDDPMYKLEHVATDTQKSEDAKPRLYNLYARNHHVWDDDYAANCKLRAAFRQRKKELKAEEERDAALLTRSSLSIPLLPESDSDVRLAAMMRLHTAKSVGERDRERRTDLINRPALPSATITSFGGLRSEKLLNSKLSQKALGITSRPAKRKPSPESAAIEAKQIKSTDDANSSSTSEHSATHCTSQSENSNASATTTNRTSSLSLPLLCNYDSSSSSENSN